MKTSRLTPLALALSVTALLPLPARPADAAKAPGRPATAKAVAPRLAVPFIDDNYAKALKEARARDVPIFIEAWAPW